MVKVELVGDKVEITILGIHKFWALKSKIVIAKENIVSVYQNKDELSSIKGLRFPGTYFPGIICAGTYYWKKGRYFWDMTNKEKTIIFELKNERYQKIYVDVENPSQCLEMF